MTKNTDQNTKNTISPVLHYYIAEQELKTIEDKIKEESFMWADSAEGQGIIQQAFQNWDSNNYLTAEQMTANVDKHFNF